MIHQARTARLFGALLLSWVLVGMLAPISYAKDAIPFGVAGSLLRDSPRDIYNQQGETLHDLNAEFAVRSCKLIETKSRCADTAVAFISPPAILPILGLLDLLGGPTMVVRVMMISSASLLALAMLLLWYRMESAGPRTRVMLVLIIILLTPFAIRIITIGQTTPFLVLSATLCFGQKDPRLRRFSELAMAGAIATKALPLVLLGLPASKGKSSEVIRVLIALVGLTLCAVFLGGKELLSEFVGGSLVASSSSATNPFNNSIDAALHSSFGTLASSVSLTLVSWLMRIIAFGWLFTLLRRHEVEDGWLIMWAGFVVLVPLSWWYYNFASLAALGVAICRGSDIERKINWLVVASIPPFIIELANLRSQILNFSYSLGLLLAVVAVLGSHEHPRARSAT